MGPEWGDDTREFGKDCTIILNVGDNQRVKATDVIRELDDKYGRGSVYACVPKAADCYEVTFANKNIAEKVTTGVTIADKQCDCDLLYSDIMVVSFMHLPAYITDAEIKLKLASYGIALKGKIKRRYYRGTRCADGTRYVKVEFPKHIKSLNYLMKFDTVYGPQMFRVKHNNQTKVCSLCLSDEHLMRQCPDFKCFRCGVQGHTKKSCEAGRCTRCSRYPVSCTCNVENNDVDEENDVSSFQPNGTQDVEQSAEQRGDDDDNGTDCDDRDDASQSDGYDDDTVHDSDVNMDDVEDEFIPGSNVTATSSNCSDNEESTQAYYGDESDTEPTEVIHSAEQSAFLVDFNSLPAGNPSCTPEELGEGEKSSGEQITAYDGKSPECDVHSNEEESMDVSGETQVDRRQKRKSGCTDKSCEVTKRVKEVLENSDTKENA